jgi:hypothetical protein
MSEITQVQDAVNTSLYAWRPPPCGRHLHMGDLTHKPELV